MIRSVPKGLRNAGIVALLTVLVASGLLYQTNVGVTRPPEFARGGAFERAEGPGRAGSPVRTPPPGLSDDGAVNGAPSAEEDAAPDEGGDDQQASAEQASAEATASTDEGADGSNSAGASDPDPGGHAPPDADAAPAPHELPQLGTYVYEVDGWERATGFGRRSYPEEMTLHAHRNADDLEADEVVFDLDFSEQHEEREIVAYQPDGLHFTYEAGSVTFGPMTQSSEADYEPPMTQTPFPLDDGVERAGTTDAREPDGDVVRTEDWTVEVLGAERIQAAGEEVDTWVVRIERETREGSSEEVERSRTYWFDPARRMWVQWEEHMRGEREIGPGTFVYETQYTATLARFRE